VQQSQEKWFITGVYVSTHWDHMQVRGRLVPRALYRLPQGHIDVAAYSLSGALIFETSTDYKKTLFFVRRKTRWRRSSNRFNVEIIEMLPEVAEIRVAFHRNDSKVGKRNKHVNMATQ